MVTIRDKILGLRDLLSEYPVCEGCHSFAGLPLYTLGQAFFPADVGLYDSCSESVSTIVLGSDWGNHKSFLAVCRS